MQLSLEFFIETVSVLLCPSTFFSILLIRIHRTDVCTIVIIFHNAEHFIISAFTIFFIDRLKYFKILCMLFICFHSCIRQILLSLHDVCNKPPVMYLFQNLNRFITILVKNGLHFRIFFLVIAITKRNREFLMPFIKLIVWEYFGQCSFQPTNQFQHLCFRHFLIDLQKFHYLFISTGICYFSRSQKCF